VSSNMSEIFSQRVSPRLKSVRLLFYQASPRLPPLIVLGPSRLERASTADLIAAKIVGPTERSVICRHWEEKLQSSLKLD
jgi:hypothetical protein